MSREAGDADALGAISALSEVLAAFLRPGKAGSRNRRRLRREWPELFGALDLMVAAAFDDPEPTP